MNVDAKPFVGELKLVNGKRSMCCEVDATYGGGYGDVWIVEDHIYDFFIRRDWDMLRGICRGVMPATKQVEMEMVAGSTWGHHGAGSVITIDVRDIHGLHTAHWHGSKLIEASRVHKSRLEASVAFCEATLDELIVNYTLEHERLVATLIGDSEFAFVKAVCETYVALSKAVTKAGYSKHRMPNSDEAQAKRKLQSLLKQNMKGTT